MYVFLQESKGRSSARVSGHNSNVNSQLERSPSLPPRKRFKHLYHPLMMSPDRPIAAIPGPELEFMNYLSVCSNLECSGGIEKAFDFWAKHRDLYPQLSLLADDLLAATASEPYCERVFSLCGDLTVRKRNRTIKSIERNVFLKINNVVRKPE